MGSRLGPGEILFTEMQKRMITVVVPYDQLSRTHGAMSKAQPESHQILMIESQNFLNSRTWHRQRLFLLLSAAEHFAIELEAEGFLVHRMQSPSVRAGITEFRRLQPDASLVATQPRSRSLQVVFEELEIELDVDDSFLTTREQFSGWAGARKSLTQEHFYRWQRNRLGYLMQGTAPIGDVWNLDSENRLPPPKSGYAWPTPPTFEPDDIDCSVMDRLSNSEYSLWGSPADETWATTRAGALQQLRWFLTHSLAGFGPYEDAMPKETWSAHHSMLSPYLNLGLINPQEVCDAAIARFDQGDIPLASIEGFIRQIIGWREYINGVYWLFPAQYEQSNSLAAHRPLLPLFEDPAATKMACMKSTISDIKQRGWVHHIPRLMLLSNLALLSGVDPQEFLGWMRRVFIDAADWVMVPNVIGMGLHADDGVMMTKPYIAGGAYIKRMGQFCNDCEYKPALRVGDQACPFTTLYWDFLDRNQSVFAGNHRMVQQFAGLRKLNNLDEVTARAQEVLSGLSQGTV
jgi:deoxyribodipyrimidine photolyase-related protein